MKKTMKWILDKIGVAILLSFVLLKWISIAYLLIFFSPVTLIVSAYFGFGWWMPLFQIMFLNLFGIKQLGLAEVLFILFVVCVLSVWSKS